MTKLIAALCALAVPDALGRARCFTLGIKPSAAEAWDITLCQRFHSARLSREVNVLSSPSDTDVDVEAKGNLQFLESKKCHWHELLSICRIRRGIIGRSNLRCSCNFFGFIVRMDLG